MVISSITGPTKVQERLSSAPTRELILDYAVSFLDEHSEADLRIASICEDCNVSISSIYHYFGNREGVVIAAEIERYARGRQSFLDEIEPAFARIDSRREFQDLMLKTFRELQKSEDASLRLKATNVLGSSMGRPELIDSISGIEQEMISRLSEMMEGPRERGWLRDDVDPLALSAWLAGSTFSRVVADFGGSKVSDEAWNQVAEMAFLSITFGDEVSAEHRVA